MPTPRPPTSTISASAAGLSQPISSIPACGDLPVRRQLACRARAGTARHRTAAAAAERGRAGCRGDPRHLRRGVGTQAHHALTDRVHQAERLLCDRGAGTGQQTVLEFQQRRLDPLIAVAGEHLHERSRPPMPRFRHRAATGRADQRAARRDCSADRRSFRPPAISYRAAAKPACHRGALEVGKPNPSKGAALVI